MQERRRGLRGLVLAVVVIGFGASASPAGAALGDGILGGPSEPSPVFDDTTCPAGTVMTGVGGETRIVAGNPVVATATAACTGPGGPVTGSTMGTPTGVDPTGSSNCPAGQVAVGIQGREGDFVDQLVLRCQAADFTGAITPAATFGGAGGGADGPIDCPAGRALTGLTGEVVFSATMVRNLRITCTTGPGPVVVTEPPVPVITPKPIVSQTVPPPVLGERLNVQKVRGTVLIAVPVAATGAGSARASQKGLRFVPLEQVRQIPVGAFLDTRRGTVRLTTARDSAGRTQSGEFSAGLFQVLQSRKRSARGLTDVVAKGSSFRVCGRARSGEANAAARRKRTIRRLRGNARGRFRTRGRYSAATVRGTVWSITDRCDGTLTKVTRGSVVVRDFRRRRNVVVKAGKRTRGGGRGSYLAKAR